MLLLLNFLNGAILEGPFDNVGLWASTLGLLAGLKSRPEVVEILELAIRMVSVCKAGQGVLVPTYIRCHTWLRCAGMRALSSTDVDVGIPEGIVMFKVCISGRAGYWLLSTSNVKYSNADSDCPASK